MNSYLKKFLHGYSSISLFPTINLDFMQKPGFDIDADNLNIDRIKNDYYKTTGRTEEEESL